MNDCPHPSINYETIDMHLFGGIALGVVFLIINGIFDLGLIGWIFLYGLGLLAFYAWHEHILPNKPGLRISLVRSDKNYISKPFEYYQYTNDSATDAKKIQEVIDKYKKLADENTTSETAIELAVQSDAEKLESQHGAIMGLLENEQKVPQLQAATPPTEPVVPENDGH